MESIRFAEGQATVEAALLIPVFLLGILIAIEPGILLYDRIVMESAASMGCRVLATLDSGEMEDAHGYIERRLSAIPDVPIFHEGSWEIDIQGGAGDANSEVRISHSVRLLPLAREAMGLAGLTNSTGSFSQQVERVQETADEWLIESEYGADAASWISRWEKAI